MPQKDLTIAEKIAVLRKIREQPPLENNNRVNRLIGPNSACPAVIRLNGFYLNCIHLIYRMSLYHWIALKLTVDYRC